MRYLIPFTFLKNKVLGQGFELSLVFVDNNFSRKLNQKYRGKNKSANVLSFLISKKMGEIFIDLVTAKKEMQKYDMDFQTFVRFLFIHALLHLKGMEHGDTMEKREIKLLHGTANRSWYRYRDV